MPSTGIDDSSARSVRIPVVGAAWTNLFGDLRMLSSIEMLWAQGIASSYTISTGSAVDNGPAPDLHEADGPLDPGAHTGIH